jgi:hypothetical protein
MAGMDLSLISGVNNKSKSLDTLIICFDISYMLGVKFLYNALAAQPRAHRP